MLCIGVKVQAPCKVHVANGSYAHFVQTCKLAPRKTGLHSLGDNQSTPAFAGKIMAVPLQLEALKKTSGFAGFRLGL